MGGALGRHSPSHPSGTYGQSGSLPGGTALLTAERVAALADAGLSRMALSTDGVTPDSHEGFRGEADSFEDTLRAARDAERAGTNTRRTNRER